MSRGLGRIERAILASIASSKQMAINRAQKPSVVVEATIIGGEVQRPGFSLKYDDSSVHITAWTLAHECFGPPHPHELDWRPSRAQIKACMRAMHSIVRKFPQYAIIPRRGPKGIVLYEIADPVSVRRAKCEKETNVTHARQTEMSVNLEGSGWERGC
jgi:hypothetical protein